MVERGSRREARERALELLYEASAKSQLPSALIAELPIRPDAFAVETVTGVERSAGELDGVLLRFLRPDWPIDRLPDIDRHLLRLAIWELLHLDTPSAVVLAESVALAKRYSTEASGRFVNGVLASVADHRDELTSRS